MKPILQTTLALAFATGFLSAADPDTEPLSPYFEIHGEHKTDVFPLKETHAEVTISGTIAQITLTQTYTNDGENAIDATYNFPASTGSAVNGMTMTIGERNKETAKPDYTAQREWTVTLWTPRGTAILRRGL